MRRNGIAAVGIDDNSENEANYESGAVSEVRDKNANIA
jgi:hypothetical protein